MQYYYSEQEQGLTLVELLVALAIFGLVAGIGILQFRTSQAHQELERAAGELAADIRWMQQLSANDATPRLSENTPIDYRYHLILDANGYVVNDNNEDRILKRRQFGNYRVKAMITVPEEAADIDMTYYAYDLDRLKVINDPASLENAEYRVRLTHDSTNAVRYINVAARVGRVWISR